MAREIASTFSFTNDQGVRAQTSEAMWGDLHLL